MQQAGSVSHLIKDKDDVFVRRVFSHIFLNEQRASAERVSSIQYLDHNVRRVDNLVQFRPDPPTLTTLQKLELYN